MMRVAKTARGHSLERAVHRLINSNSKYILRRIRCDRALFYLHVSLEIINLRKLFLFQLRLIWCHIPSLDVEKLSVFHSYQIEVMKPKTSFIVVNPPFCVQDLNSLQLNDSVLVVVEDVDECAFIELHQVFCLQFSLNFSIAFRKLSLYA